MRSLHRQLFISHAIAAFIHFISLIFSWIVVPDAHYSILQKIRITLLDPIPNNTNSIPFNMFLNTTFSNLSDNKIANPIIAIAINETLTFISHFIAVALLLKPNMKNNNRKIRIYEKYRRWIEYSITAGLITTSILVSVGVFDIISLTLMFTLNICQQLCGLVIETVESTNWAPPQICAFVSGCIAQIIQYAVIITYVVGSDLLPNTNKIAVLTLDIILYSLFAVHLFISREQIVWWPDKDIGFTILSCTTKIILSWSIIASVYEGLILLDSDFDTVNVNWSALQWSITSIGIVILIVLFIICAKFKPTTENDYGSTDTNTEKILNTKYIYNNLRRRI
jgi:hypothetical protein